MAYPIAILGAPDVILANFAGDGRTHSRTPML